MNFTYAKGYNLERLTDANRAYSTTTPISANGEPQLQHHTPEPVLHDDHRVRLRRASRSYYAITFVTNKRFTNNFSANVTAT